LSGYLLEIYVSIYAYLSENHAEGIFNSAFAGYFGVGILGETGVEN